MELKVLIRNSEERVKSYKTLLEQVNRDKNSFPPGNEFVIWYKSILRENKNREEKWLKDLIDERTFENQKLNPPFLYKY
jgi:hypothetical protein